MLQLCYKQMFGVMTRNEIFYFLNEVDISDKLNNDRIDRIKEVKKTVVTEFEVVNLSKMLYVLNINDELKLSYVSNDNDIHYRLERIQSLRENIIYLVSLKNVVITEKPEGS